ncbi:MAG TPA: ABC-2 transporter permease, partial [Candidatus Merdisoma merdipullorum]|nr:ABC-2 transporter permease [Candidatus Merdisoma merdipullorum]
RDAMNIANNPVGLDATVAWYGFGFILYAVFDLVFLTAFYKSGYKVGKSFVLAAIPMVFLMASIEATSYVPALVWLDSCRPEHLLAQLPILITGIVCYGILVPLAYRISARRFESVDL